MQHPHNALDKFKTAVDTHLARFDIGVEWWENGGEFILMVRRADTEIKLILKFYDGFYKIEDVEFPGNISTASSERFIQTMRNKLDACIYNL